MSIDCESTIEDSHGTYGQPILQAKQTVKSDVFSVTVNNLNWENITGLDVSITPQSTSSKILVMVTIGGWTCPHTNQRFAFAMKRDTTLIGLADSAGNRVRASVATQNFEGGTNGIENGVAFNFLDSPSTTSSVTYRTCLNAEGNGLTVAINRSDGDSNNNETFRACSTITAFEIGG